MASCLEKGKKLAAAVVVQWIDKGWSLAQPFTCCCDDLMEHGPHTPSLSLVCLARSNAYSGTGRAAREQHVATERVYLCSLLKELTFSKSWTS